MDARSDVPRFGLGWVCWLAGGVASLLAGWILWRVAGRSRRAGQVGFVLVLLLAVAGQAVGIAQHAIVLNTVHQLREAQSRRLEDLMARLPEPLTPDERRAAVVALDAYFDPVRGRSDRERQDPGRGRSRPSSAQR